MGQPLGHPRGTHGEWHSFGISFFPAGEGSCLVLETTSQNLWVCSSFGQRYIALDQRFFLVPFYFISMPNFDFMLWVFIIPLGKGYLSLILCPFTQGLWMAFVGHGKQFLRAIPRVDPITSKIFGILRHIFPSVTFLWPLVFTAMRSLPSWRFWTSIQRKVKEIKKLYYFVLCSIRSQ